AGQKLAVGVSDGPEPSAGIVFVALVSFGRAVTDAGQAAVGVVLVGFVASLEQPVVVGVFPGGWAGGAVAEPVAHGVVAVGIAAVVG
ncbi:hypothetical protein, partial [Thiolapillus sp.]